MSAAAPFSIGSPLWNGLSKVQEESGELTEALVLAALGRLQQACGKVIGCGGAETHFDGQSVEDKVVEEMGDLWAAMTFLAHKRGSQFQAAVAMRALQKMALFEQWDAENRETRQ